MDILAREVYQELPVQKVKEDNVVLEDLMDPQVYKGNVVQLVPRVCQVQMERLDKKVNQEIEV